MSESRHTLLVVDDEKQILDSVQRLFRRTFQVLTAQSGKEALGILSERPTDLILSDQRMPDMTGDEFLSLALKLAPDSVRILFTGYADIEAVTRAVNRGKIYGYVAKPWNASDLETLVLQAARHFELAEANRVLTSQLRDANAALERKVRERTRELEELEDYKESLLRSQGGGMLVVDLTGKITSFNPSGAAILGLDPSCCIGGRFVDLPEFRPFQDELTRSLSTGKPGEYQETEITLADGSTRYAGYVINPLLMRTGERRGAIVSFSDITEKRQMEMQLNQSEKLSMIGQLAGGVAHEINNPLGVILGFAQILLKQENTEQNQKRLANIERQALRCKEIVGKLLRFARRSNMQTGPVRVNTALDEVLGLLGRQLEMEHIRLVTRVEPELPEISGDENELQQVFFNLIVNARDALASAGPQPPGDLVLTVESRRQGDWIEVRVTDNGVGIPEHRRDKIFDPFYTTKEPGHGTGLGLSVSRGIVQRHGGDLQLERGSADGDTTFLVRLPIPSKPPPAISLPEEVLAAATKGLRILVVDDEEDIRDICADYLGETNDVVTVKSGPLAIAELKSRPYGLVLLDVMMPEMDGVTALEKIRELGITVPVVIMTGKMDERIQQTKERLSVTEILEKPFSIVELERVLERVAGKQE